MVKWVNPTGDMTPTRPETAARLGNAAQATKRVAEGIHGELELSRIQWDQSQRLRWPETAAATSTAAVRARLSAGEVLRLADERAKQRGGLLGAPGACWCHWTERR